MTVPVPPAPAWRPAPLRLHAGHLSALFEPDTGWLRHLSLGGYELIRAVYGAVRDQHWRTITPRIAALDTVVRERTFDIQFLNRCEEGDIAFAWQAHIRGTAEGHCSFRFDGEARSSFLRNRIGLCLLHPLDGCAGRPCTIEHVDGTRTERAFPDLVAPHQPFLAIRSLAWDTGAGRVTVRFEGETFETEDQRNWSDASFKTYGTPVDRPRPVQVSAGDRVQQRIEILIEPARTMVPVAEGRVLELEPTGDWRSLPRIGLTAGPLVDSLTPGHQALLRALGADHLRADVRPDGEEVHDLAARVAGAGQTASGIGARLHLAALLGEDEHGGLARLASAAREAGVAADVLLVLADHAPTPTPDAVEAARRLFVDAGLARAIGAGTNRYFAELNRNRPAAGTGALPVFSLNPQVHAFDELSIMENLEALPSMVATLRGFSEQPAVISPLSLRPRFTPDAPHRVVIGRDGRPENVDFRQRTVFGAAWTLGSLAHLLPLEGVHSLTYFETDGPRGLLEGDGVFPLYHALADVAGATRVRALTSSMPSRVLGVLVEREGGMRLLAANLTDHPTRLRLSLPSDTCRVRMLDARSARQAATDPVAFRNQAESPTVPGGRCEMELPAYATVRLDW
jgi:D-apionolactonase